VIAVGPRPPTANALFRSVVSLAPIAPPQSVVKSSTKIRSLCSKTQPCRQLGSLSFRRSLASQSLLQSRLGKRAVDLGWIKTNPARGVELRKILEPDKVFLSYREVESLVRAAEETTGRVADAMMIELMAFAGLRPGEVVALQIKHVDLPARRIRVRHTATIDIHGSAIFGEPKHGERREVPIASHFVAQLELLIEGKPAAAPHSRPHGRRGGRRCKGRATDARSRRRVYDSKYLRRPVARPAGRGGDGNLRATGESNRGAECHSAGFAQLGRSALREFVECARPFFCSTREVSPSDHKIHDSISSGLHNMWDVVRLP